MKLADLVNGRVKNLPCVAGNPDEVVLSIPMHTAVVARGDPSLTLEQYDSVLEADASYFPRDRVEGQAWRLTVNGKEYKVKTKARRYGRGPATAELRAIIDGLKEASAKGSRRIIVKTDNRWSAHILTGLWSARQEYTIPLAAEALGLLENFETASVIHTRTKKIRKVDRAARRAAEDRQTQARNQDAKRLEKIEEAIQRAQTVHLQRTPAGWRANEYFAVVVNPPSCTCPGWTLRWTNVPLAGKRARRLPCKHLVAAALREGVSTHEELSVLPRRARN
jgi:ribonuclease HI